MKFYQENARFSFVEMLVPMSIIAIVSSLFAPSLHKTFVFIQLTECKNNEIIIYEALSLYIDDNQGICPGVM